MRDRVAVGLANWILNRFATKDYCDFTRAVVKMGLTEFDKELYKMVKEEENTNAA